MNATICEVICRPRLAWSVNATLFVDAAPISALVAPSEVNVSVRGETTVHIHADLIIGLPGETVQGFAAGFDLNAIPVSAIEPDTANPNQDIYRNCGI